MSDRTSRTALVVIAMLIVAAAGQAQIGTADQTLGIDPALVEAWRLAHPEGNVPTIEQGHALGWNTGETTLVDVNVANPEVLTPRSDGATPPGWAIYAGEYVGGLVYMVDDNDTLWEVSPENGEVLRSFPVTPAITGNPTGMAVDPTDNQVYFASTDGSTSQIARLDIWSGTLTNIGTVTNSTTLIALAIDGSGTMYGYDIVTDELLSIDKATAAGTVIGSIGFDANYAQGLGWDRDTDILYMSAFNNSEFRAELRTVDRSTGMTTLVGALGVGPTLHQVTWLGFDNLSPINEFAAFSLDQLNSNAYTLFTDPRSLPSRSTINTGGAFPGAGEFIDGFAYIVDTAFQLHKVTAHTGDVVSVLPVTAPNNGETYTGMAVDPADGTVYLASTNISQSHLFTLNLNNGAATMVAEIPNSPGVIAIAFDGAGSLYSYDIVTDTLHEIDPSTAIDRIVGPIGFDANYGQGMAWDPNSQTLFMTAYNNQAGAAELRSVDRFSGASSYVCTLGSRLPAAMTLLPWVGFTDASYIELFIDGFESGNKDNWAQSVP